MATERPSESPYKWWVVFMLWFVCFFNYADRQSIMSVFPKLEEEFGFNKELTGLIGTAFAVIYAGASPLAGIVGERVRRKTLILGGLFFWSLVTMATSWAQNFGHFYLIRALEGFGEAFYFPASMALISDFHTRVTRSRALSLHQSSVYVGIVGGGFLGGYFAEQWGWRSGFYFFGSAGMLLSLVLLICLREPARGQSEEKPEKTLPLQEVLRIIFSQPRAWLLMLVFIGANSVANNFMVWAPTFIYEKFHTRLSVAGLTGTAPIHLASMIGAPLGGMLADRLAKKFAGGRMAVQCLGLLAGASFVWLTGMAGEMRVLIASMLAFGFCKGLYDSNIFASLYDVIPSNARSAAAGMMNMVGWLGGSILPMVLGSMAAQSGKAKEIETMSKGLASGGFIYVGGAALLGLAIWMSRRRGRTPELSSDEGGVKC